jgi:hypothetical protein
MKGMHNRQKMVVRPRETAQKYIIQQKSIQTGKGSKRREGGRKGLASKEK